MITKFEEKILCAFCRLLWLSELGFVVNGSLGPSTSEADWKSNRDMISSLLALDFPVVTSTPKSENIAPKLLLAPHCR